jgi:hypothetical protein
MSLSRSESAWVSPIMKRILSGVLTGEQCGAQDGRREHCR